MKLCWTEKLLGDVITLQRGFDLPERERRAGSVPIVSSSGITGYHSAEKCIAPGVVTGRYGTLGEVFYIERAYWPLNTTLWVTNMCSIRMRGRETDSTRGCNGQRGIECKGTGRG